MMRHNFPIILCSIAVAMVGCRSVPEYKGDGQIKNTSSWGEGVFWFRQQSIILPSFGLNEPIEREFDLGNIAFYRNTWIKVRLQFPDDHAWERFSKLDPAEKTERSIAKFRMRDLDPLTGRLQFRVFEESGTELCRSDKLLRDYVWSGLPSVADIYDPSNTRTPIKRGMHLKLRVSYTGEPQLTNRASLVVICLPK